MTTVTVPAPVIEDYPVAPTRRSAITRDDIIGAFERTGLKPIRLTWGDSVATGCALTALSIDRTGSMQADGMQRINSLGLSQVEGSVIMTAWDTLTALCLDEGYDDLFEEVRAARKVLLGV